MAIQMTRAEYEARYGVAPVKPAISTGPVKMTRAEYEAKYGGQIPVQTGYNVPKPEVSREQNLLKLQNEAKQAEVESKKANSVGGFLGNFGKSFVENIAPSQVGLGKTIAKVVSKQPEKTSQLIEQNANQRVSLSKLIREKDKKGEDTLKAKQIYNDLIDKAKELGVKLTDDAKLPTTGEVIGQIGGTVLDVLTAGTFQKAKTGANLTSKVATGVGLPELGQIAKQKAGGLFTKQGAKNIATGAGIGYASDVTMGMQGLRGEDREGSGAFIPGFGTVIGAGIPAISETAKSIKTGLSPEYKDMRAKAKVNDIISKRQEEIRNIEGNYANTRKANKFSKDEGLASRKRVASTDVLVGAVDTDGTIRTLTKGGAVDQYKQMTLDKTENVVKKNLARLGEKTSLRKVERELIDQVNKSGLEGDDLKRALNGVKKEIAGYRLKADANDFVPVELIHDAKVNQYKNINFQTPPETATFRKSIARGLKNIVETDSSFNSEEVNKEISKYLEDIKLLERLDGKKVKGGKLGKYFAQISGNIIGGLAGGAVGGPAGSAVGTIIGGEVAGRIKGNILSRTLGKSTGNLAPKSKILEKAIKTGNEPQLMLSAGSKTAPKIKMESGKTINLPSKSQSTIDEAYLKSFGSRNIRYSSTKTPSNIYIPKSIPKMEASASKSVENILSNKKLQEYANKAKNSSEFRHLIEYNRNDDVLTALEKYRKDISSQTDLLKTYDDLFEKLKETKKVSLLKKFKDTLPKNTKGGFISTGYKETGDLTTKILKDLEGKTTVSKQYILDATNRGELKQVERDLIREALENEKDVVNVADFAKKVKAELLPLKVVGSSQKPNSMDIFYGSNTGHRYENIALPDDVRGKVANYQERIYESPVKTSAGDVHFKDKTDSYFGHTRIEDMADNKTRRVIEVQSDLYQKGNLEREFSEEAIDKFGAKAYDKSSGSLKDAVNAENTARQARRIEAQKLQQYNDPTAHFRMIREEIKKAAQDDKTKLQFPTGETAMKIEGLGDNTNWRRQSTYATNNYHKLTTDDLKVGANVNDGNSDWIITEVLGDGKFKAVQKKDFSDEAIKNIQNGGFPTARVNQLAESFDISGKVDTNNPIYKFYEKDIQKYLNKFGGKKVVDDKGVSWIEIPITKEQGKAPVEAFGKIKVNLLMAGAVLSGAGVLGASYIKSKKDKK